MRALRTSAFISTSICSPRSSMALMVSLPSAASTSVIAANETRFVIGSSIFPMITDYEPAALRKTFPSSATGPHSIVLEGQGDELNLFCNASNEVSSCTDHSGIPRRFPQKSRDAACRAGTFLSPPVSRPLRECFGPTKQRHTLRALPIEMSAQRSAGSQVNSNHRIASSPPSSSRSPVAHRSAG